MTNLLSRVIKQNVIVTPLLIRTVINQHLSCPVACNPDKQCRRCSKVFILKYKNRRNFSENMEKQKKIPFYPATSKMRWPGLIANFYNFEKAFMKPLRHNFENLVHLVFVSH